jgi:tRNA(Ile)-lysidine synthase
MGDSKTNPAVEKLLERVAEFMHRHEMCASPKRILVACSGGPDSTALMDMLRSLGPRTGFEIGVLYVDHRQHEQAGRILARLRARCRRWKLPFYSTRLDVPPGSAEDLLRRERYRVFHQLSVRHGYSRVATGHTQSDQVETVLMRILRGTGVAGLGGIPAVRGIFIRPLLECSREEILAYLETRRLSWHQDPTNRDQAFLRNRVRHQILPLLRRRVNPAVDRALLRLAAAAARDNHFIESLRDNVPAGRLPDGVVRLPLTSFDRLHDSLAIRVVLDMLRSISPPGANLEKLHTDRILSMIRRRSGGGDWRLDLPGGVTAGKEGKSLYLRQGASRTATGFHLEVGKPGDVELPAGESYLRFRLVSRREPLGAGRRSACFDADLVGFPLQVRSAEPGDRLRVWGGGGNRKVSRLLIDAKIPRNLRPQVPLLVKDDEILWVAGLRRSDIAPVGARTRRVLSVELRPR